MRVGIYVDVAREPNPRGVGFHVLQLLRGLAEVDRTTEYLLYYRQDLGVSGDGFPHRPAQPNFRVRPVRFPAPWVHRYPRAWWNHYLPALLQRDRVDVFHGPSHFLPRLRRRNTVVTIHDLAFFRMALYDPAMTAALREWTGQALREAGRVIAISQNTRADIEGLGVEPGRIRLVYGGGNVVPDADIQYDRQEELRRTFTLPDRYVLFVGTVHPRKNVPFLLRAFAEVKRRHGLPHKLVLAGKPDAASNDVAALASELGIASDTIVTGYVEDWQVPLLYKSADVFVLPTLYEGFTLVTLEAMAYGVPVISTDTSSIREGVGDAGMLVPVNDVEALATALHRVLTEPGLAADMVRKGRQQAEQFTWTRCARETLQVYREVHELTAP